jgi:hypothetical protein
MRQGTHSFRNEWRPMNGTSLRFTGSLATKLGIYPVSVCDLAQFLENFLGNNSRLHYRFTIM